MKIKDDEAFVWAACAETRLTARDQIVRCGQECIVQRRDDSDGLLLCLFSDCKSVWFPETCVVENEPEETTPDTPDPIKSLRDEFAMGAMETLLLALLDSATKLDEVGLAETSYKIANAMMEERKK